MSGVRHLSFDEVFEDATGGNVKTLQSEYQPAGRLPVIDQGQEFIAGYIDDEGATCAAKPPVIVFGDHTCIFKYVDFPFALGADGVKVLKPKIEADTRYLYYCLRRVHLPDTGYDRHFKYLKRATIPLPPLAEQKRIAAVLDKADDLRAKRRHSLSTLDTLLQSVFLDMFGDPVTNPKGWPTKRLAELVRSGDTINYGVVQPGDERAHGVPLVRVGDFANRRIEHAALKRIDPSIEKAYTRSRLKGDEILISCVGSIGMIALVDPDLRGFNIARAVARVPLAASVSRQFIASFLETAPIQHYFSAETRTVSQPTLNIKQISATKVLVPPHSLQLEFEESAHAIERARVRLACAQDEVDGLFASVQSAAFAGTLFANSARSPSEPPAPARQLPCNSVRACPASHKWDARKASLPL